MNPKALIPLVGGLAVAGLAGKFGWDYIQKAQAKPVNLVTLWAPTQEIPRGMEISETQLTAVRFPAESTPGDALTDKAKIIGRVPHTGCPAGLPVLDNMLLPPGTKAGIYVPHGMRAVAVKVDEGSGVDFHLRPGDHVDVIGYFQVRANNRDETIARTIIENVEIGAVGPQIASDRPAKADGKDKDNKAATTDSHYDKPPRAVTLFVQPDAVPKLHLAEQRGKLKLAMRNDEDSGVNAKNEASNESELLGQDKPKPAPDENRPMPANWQQQVAQMMHDFMKENAAKATPPADPAEPPAPAETSGYAWQMTIYNGAEKTRLAWKDKHSAQPIDVTGEGPNLFQDKPAPTKGGTLPKHPPVKPTEPPADDSQPTPTSKPQELFE